MNKPERLKERSVDHLPTLRRYACTLVGEQQADDLVHEALVRAYAAHHQFRADGNLRNWLLSILHNCFVSKWRRSRAESAAIEHLGFQSPESARPNQEDAVHLAELLRAIATLSVDHRAVLHLIVVEGLSYEAAADVLGIPAGTVMSRLSRARAKLREVTAGEVHRLKLVGGGNGKAS
jgi:RNA polymerase sigma-70 factor (ECF subfamily)